MRLLMIALAIAFPLIAHAAIVSHKGSLTIASLAVLALLVMLPRLLQWKLAAWCALPFVVGGLVVLWRVHAALLPLYAMPVLISFGVAWLFGHTLVRGEVPLVERLARVMHGPDGVTEAVRIYARKVTVAWTVLMSAMGLLNLTLALIAWPDGVLLLMGIQPPVTVHVETWSLFANLLNYVIVAAFFIAEYVYRHRRFPEQRLRYRNMFDFVRRAAAIGPSVLRARDD